MNRLTAELERAATNFATEPQLDDVLVRSGRRRTRTRRRYAVGTTVAAMAVVGAAVTFGRGPAEGEQQADQPPVESGGIPLAPVASADLGKARGMVITTSDPSGGSTPAPGSGLVRLDPNSTDRGQPFVVVLRRDGGHLGQDTVTITFPATPTLTAPQRPLDMLGDTITAVERSRLILNTPDGMLQLQGAGISRAVLLDIAESVDIVDGRPRVALAQMSEFSEWTTDSAAPAWTAGARYGCFDLGEADALGNGLCYTEMAPLAGFQQAILRDGFILGPLIDGHQSVVSAVGGGNATLAWEPEPGIVAMIGYSGSMYGEEQLAAMVRLANRTTQLPTEEWARVEAQVVSQDNAWG